MQFQLNSTNNIHSDQRLAEAVESIVRDDLERFGERLTRVEIHVSDENSRVKGGGNDKKCLIEARLAGLDPSSVSHSAPSLEEAVRGASTKMQRKLDSLIGKLNNKHHEKLTKLEEE